MRAGAAHQRLDVEDDALTDGALEIISADLGGDDKVAHEHAVEFAFLVASANDPAASNRQSIFGEASGLRPLARDQIADESDGGGIDRRLADRGRDKARPGIREHPGAPAAIAERQAPRGNQPGR